MAHPGGLPRTRRTEHQTETDQLLLKFMRPHGRGTPPRGASEGGA